MALLKNLNTTTTESTREINATAAGKVQMNIRVTPALRRKIKSRALEMDIYPCDLIADVMGEYFDEEESETIARK